MFKQILVGCFFISFLSISFADEVEDPNLWLEDVDGEEALAWVQKTNKATDNTLGSDPLYEEIYQDVLNALNSKDRLPEITQRGDWIYYLHKDAQHPRGVYQRSKLAGFKSGKPDWQTVLDIDAMSKADDVKWVFKGMDCLKPENEKCLVSLSPGGSDAHELREFNSITLEFVDEGFKLPTAKMRVSWMDENNLFVGTNFGEGSMTESGYPRIIKIWRRGTPLSSAKTVLETDTKSVWSYAIRFRDESGNNIDMLVEGLSFWTNRYYQYINGTKVQLFLPESAVVEDAINGQLVVSLQEDWSFNEQQYKQGSLVLVSPKTLRDKKGAITLLATSKPSAIIEGVTVTKNSLLVTVLENVKSRVYRYQVSKNGWQSSLVNLPKSGKITIETSNDETGEFFARYEDFLTPPTLYSVDSALNVTVALQQSTTFDSSNMKVEQFFAESKDGTGIPYFVVMSKDTKFNKKNPTHIFAYGGFRASLTPSYSGSYENHNGAYGKAWLERGGVFVLANIRGGGEYGPAWHAAALLENRVKSYEDFEAVAKDLFKRKITSAKHLGIEGRSNGGLLVGATMVRQPKLYGAVICGVPLLDMKRYSKLLAGASWMAEYGNPDTDDWEYIKKYSPYQNVKAKKKYPPIFFFTSTRDDRVHPGHARKMAEKMTSQGHKIEYYENTEGGHKGSATSEQTAKRIALSFTHLWRHLK